MQVSHSYQLNGEADYVSSWKPYIAAGVDRRSHGEVGDGSGRELEQPFWCEHEPESTHSCLLRYSGPKMTQLRAQALLADVPVVHRLRPRLVEPYRAKHRLRARQLFVQL